MCKKYKGAELARVMLGSPPETPGLFPAQIRPKLHSSQPLLVFHPQQQNFTPVLVEIYKVSVSQLLQPVVISQDASTTLWRIITALFSISCKLTGDLVHHSDH